MNLEPQIYLDPYYMQGQIDSMRALIVGLAKTINIEEFKKNSLNSLEELKVSYEIMPFSQKRHQALDNYISFVKDLSDKDD